MRTDLIGNDICLHQRVSALQSGVIRRLRMSDALVDKRHRPVRVIIALEICLNLLQASVVTVGVQSRCLCYTGLDVLLHFVADWDRHLAGSVADHVLSLVEGHVFSSLQCFALGSSQFQCAVTEALVCNQSYNESE